MDADGGRNYAQVLERDVKKWEPVFDPKSRDNKNLERAFDSIKMSPRSHTLQRHLDQHPLFHRIGVRNRYLTVAAPYEF